jgi:hypothetical protein
MAHGDARVEKWRGNKRMEWITDKCHMTAEQRLARAVQTLQADVHSSPASCRLNWPPPPPRGCLKGSERLTERRKLVSARVPSHFKRSLPLVISHPMPLVFHFHLPFRQHSVRACSVTLWPSYRMQRPLTYVSRGQSDQIMSDVLLLNFKW